MKKIITLLLAVTMIFSLAVCVNAAGENDVATGINVRWEDGDIVTVTVSAVGLDSFGGTWLSFTYPAGLTLVNLDKTTPTTDSTAVADYVEILHSKINDYLNSNKNKIASKRFGIDSAAKAVEGYIDATSETELFKVYFKKDAGTTVDATTFVNYYNGMGGKTFYINNQNKTYFNAAGSCGYSYIAQKSNFSATVSGTTITCAGKVDATVSNYGVEFTAASTVGGTRAQKYYGAMNGDTVGNYNGNTTFTIGDWNGSFEIVLEGVHAGEKELNFFADDAIIANSNCKVTVQ